MTKLDAYIWSIQVEQKDLESWGRKRKKKVVTYRFSRKSEIE